MPGSFAQLQQLVELDLSRNNLSTFPTEVTDLSNLSSLNLSQNALPNLPDQIGKLIHLKSLDLSNNRLSSLPPGFVQLNQLTALDLSKNQFDIFPSEIGSLTDLRELNLSDNRFTDLPDNITALSDLKKLNLSKNRFASLPSALLKLTSLDWLSLEDNQLTDLPDDLIKLTKLARIHVQGNPFEALPEFTEITDPRRLFSFLTERAKSQAKSQLRPLNETKLLIVGEAEVGKTSLVNRLLNDRYNHEESSTKGITITPWEIPVNGVSIKVNIWDFGGQEIMHTTHQFFLTKRSVYALVLDSRRGEHESRLEYWLKLIRSFAGDSPIIVICNKADQGKIALNWSGLERKYGIHAFVREVSCKEGKGFDEIKELLAQIVKQLKHINDPLPSNWFVVKSELEQKKLEKDLISYEEYRQIAASYNVEDAVSQENLLRYLHDLGIVMWFGDVPHLTNTNVLNPEWITQAVYSILNSHLLFQQRGQLRIDQLKDILDSKKYPRASYPFIIDLMRYFELCFAFEHSGQEYLLIPDLLQKEESYTGEWDSSLSFEIHYDVLPGSIMSRFIVRMYIYIQQNTYWRDGVVLAYDNSTRALVRSDFIERKVTINVTGPLEERRRFLEIIRANFRAIHATISNIEATEWVPVPGTQGIVSYESLLQNERHRIDEFVPTGMSEPVSVRQLLEGVDPPEKRSRLTIPEARKFEEPIELENPIPLALRKLLSALVETLLKVSAASNFIGRTALLLNIPGYNSLNRSSVNARADLNLLVQQLWDRENTFSPDHPLYILIENALPFVGNEETLIGQDLVELRHQLAIAYQAGGETEPPPMSVIQLESEPQIVSSKKQFKAIFGLNDDRRPLKYIENDYERQDGIVKDHATGLMWQQSGSGTELTYEQAQAYVQQLNKDKFAGYNDWRLPTIPELMSLLEEQEQPSHLFISPIFDSRQLACWSANSLPNGEIDALPPKAAWFISFKQGSVHPDSLTTDHYVRCVRSCK